MDFILRKWNLDDAQSVFKYANNSKIANNLTNQFPFPYSMEDAVSYVTSCVTDDETKRCLRAIVINGEAVGSIGLFIKDDIYCKNAEIGYWLGEPFWNHDIVSRAVKQLCDYAFEHYALNRIYAVPFDYNTGSRRALEKAGFSLEGTLKKSVYKNGVVYDSCMYALIK